MKKFHIMTAVFVCIMFAAIGCAQKNTVPNNPECNLTSSFSTEDLLEDYDYMWDTLEAEYLFFPILEEFDIKWKDIKNNTRNSIVTMEPDLNDYYNVLREMFLQMGSFAHIGVIDKYTFEIYQQHYNDVDSPDTAYKDALQKVQTQYTYGTLLNQNALVEKRMDLPEISETYYANKKTVVFKIPSFDSNIVDRDAHFIEKYLSTLEKAEIENIVFDITGNSGGSDYYWMDNIVKPFGGSYTRTSTLYMKYSDLTEKYFGDYELQPIENFPEDKYLPEFVEQLDITHYITAQDPIEGTTQLSDMALKCKRWVLIDNRVYSSADAFADFCKSTGWATLVGTATKGDGIGTTPILISLPNTGLLVRFSVMAGANHAGQLNTLYGTYPDYYIDPKGYEHPLSALYRILEQYSAF